VGEVAKKEVPHPIDARLNHPAQLSGKPSASYAGSISKEGVV